MGKLAFLVFAVFCQVILAIHIELSDEMLETRNSRDSKPPTEINFNEYFFPEKLNGRNWLQPTGKSEQIESKDECYGDDCSYGLKHTLKFDFSNNDFFSYKFKHSNTHSYRIYFNGYKTCQTSDPIIYVPHGVKELVVKSTEVDFNFIFSPGNEKSLKPEPHISYTDNLRGFCKSDNDPSTIFNLLNDLEPEENQKGIKNFYRRLFAKIGPKLFFYNKMEPKTKQTYMTINTFFGKETHIWNYTGRYYFLEECKEQSWNIISVVPTKCSTLYNITIEEVETGKRHYLSASDLHSKQVVRFKDSNLRFKVNDFRVSDDPQQRLYFKTSKFYTNVGRKETFPLEEGISGERLYGRYFKGQFSTDSFDSNFVNMEPMISTCMDYNKFLLLSQKTSRLEKLKRLSIKFESHKLNYHDIVRQLCSENGKPYVFKTSSEKISRLLDTKSEFFLPITEYFDRKSILGHLVLEIMEIHGQSGTNNFEEDDISTFTRNIFSHLRSTCNITGILAGSVFSYHVDNYWTFKNNFKNFNLKGSLVSNSGSLLRTFNILEEGEFKFNGVESAEESGKIWLKIGNYTNEITCTVNPAPNPYHPGVLPDDTEVVDNHRSFTPSDMFNLFGFFGGKFGSLVGTIMAVACYISIVIVIIGLIAFCTYFNCVFTRFTSCFKRKSVQKHLELREFPKSVPSYPSYQPPSYSYYRPYSGKPYEPITRYQLLPQTQNPYQNPAQNPTQNPSKTIIHLEDWKKDWNKNLNKDWNKNLNKNLSKNRNKVPSEAYGNNQPEAVGLLNTSKV